jgi:thiamine-phosphate pyrophosphorylase
VLRLIDANLNRMGEGLRVLEDIARFHLDDAGLCRQLKTLRHELLEGSFSPELLAARRVEKDVGASTKLPGEAGRAGLPQVAVANSRRIQESLRVLEELAKLGDTPLTLESARFESARFLVYEIEQKLLFKLLRKDKINRLKGLYLILDSKSLEGRDEVLVASQAILGGVKIIQIRDKFNNKSKLLETARRLKALCEEKEVLFIVNDYLDIAQACGADGVHLGQGDMPLAEARSLLSPDKVIGCSAANLSESLKAESEGADYIAVGSIYPTSSKKDFRLAGLETLRQVRGKISLPLIAIGGINAGNTVEVMEAGADGIAVISAVLGAGSVERAARDLTTKIERAGSENE